MNKDVKFVLITGTSCLTLVCGFSYLLFSCLVTIFTMFANINLDFLMDDDLTDYEDVRITITIVDDTVVEKTEPEPVKSEPITHLPFHAGIRGYGTSRFGDFGLRPPVDFMCPENTYSSLIPTVGWQCNDY